MKHRKKAPLSALESKVMQVVWDGETATAEQVRTELEKTQSIKDSTVRTILRRLEEKGYLQHTTEGRTYVYSPTVASRNVAVDAVRGIINRFCHGSVEDLLVGMVDDEIVSPEKLRQLAQRIAKAEASSGHRGRSKER